MIEITLKLEDGMVLSISSKKEKTFDEQIIDVTGQADNLIPSGGQIEVQELIKNVIKPYLTTTKPEVVPFLSVLKGLKGFVNPLETLGAVNQWQKIFKDKAKTVVTPATLPPQKDDISGLVYDKSADKHRLITRYGEEWTFHNNLPITFEITGFNKDGIHSTIPANIEDQEKRDYVFAAFKDGKLIGVEDSGGSFNSHLGKHHGEATHVIGFHVRNGKMVGRTLLKQV